MKRGVTIAVFVGAALYACAHPHPVDPLAQRRYLIPATGRNFDLLCAEPTGFDPPVLRCRTLGEIRDYLWTQKAGP